MRELTMNEMSDVAGGVDLSVSVTVPGAVLLPAGQVVVLPIDFNVSARMQGTLTNAGVQAFNWGVAGAAAAKSGGPAQVIRGAISGFIAGFIGSFDYSVDANWVWQSSPC